MSTSSSPPPDSPASNGASDTTLNAVDLSSKPAARYLLSCPDELLVEIFSYGCAGPDDYVDSQILRSNPERAHAPFVVAAVCRHWRTVALTHATLWHYVTIPDISGDESIVDWLPGYINIVLDRSRDGPIDIITHFLCASAERIAAMEPIFSALERNSRRWRRFAIVMYGAPAVTRVLEMLTQPTPNMKTLELARQQWADDHTFTIDDSDSETADIHEDTIPRGKALLPDTSVLRSISLINVPQIIRNWPTTDGPKTKFYTLEIVQRVLAAPTWNLFSRQYADAEWLLLGARVVELPEEPPNFVFPNLDLLWIHHAVYEVLARYSDELTTPVLRELVMVGGRFSALATWLYRIRIHLRNLDLRRLDKFDQADLDALVTLERLEVLQLSGRMVVPNALLALMGQDGAETEKNTGNDSRVMWPRLHLFELYSAVFGDSDPVVESQLVWVARMRAQDGALDEHGLPRWVKLKFGFVGRCYIGESLIATMREAGAEVRVE